MTKTIVLLLGIALCTAIFVAVNVTAGWSTFSVICLLGGIICILVYAYLQGKKNQFWQQRKTRRNANVLAIAISLLIIVSLINVLGVRYNTRWDLTENQIHTLSPESQAILSQLERPLEVLVFDRQLDPTLEDLLQNYYRMGEEFNFKLIDPEQELGLAEEYNVQSLGEIYLKYGDKKQKLPVNNEVTGKVITEIQLTNAITNIQRDRSIKIDFLQGHGEVSWGLVERGIAQLIDALEVQGNNVRELNLASRGKIPEDTNLIIIAGATRKLLAGEVSILQKYLQNGGNLLIFLSPNIDLGIDSIFQQWGIELDNRLIVDGSDAGNIMGFGPGVTIVNKYGDHPITANFHNGISIFPESRPLKIKPQADIVHTPLAISNHKTWAESNLKSEEITFDSTQDLSGPLNIAIALEQKQSPLARMVLFGSSTFTTNGWFEQQLNRDLILNSISWLVGEDSKIMGIRPKEAANRRINLSLLQTTVLDWLALRIVPFIAILIAIILWCQRS